MHPAAGRNKFQFSQLSCAVQLALALNCTLILPKVGKTGHEVFCWKQLLWFSQLYGIQLALALILSQCRSLSLMRSDQFLEH